MKPLKVLFFPLSVFISHTTRCLCVAEELQKRGHKIEFVACKKYEALIKKYNFPVHTVSEINYAKEVVFGAPDNYHLRYNSALHKEKFGLQTMVEDDSDVINKVQPDIVVYDGRATALFPAFKKNIPCVEIRNLIGHLFKSDREYLSRNGVTRKYYSNENDEQKFVSEFYYAVRNYAVDLDEFAQKKYFPVPVIIPGISEFEIADSVNHFEMRRNCFTGPLDWKGFDEQNIDVEYLKNKTVIVIATGSTFPFKKVIETVFNAFADEKYHVIANVGDNFDEYKNANIPANCEVLKYIPLAKYLRYANVVIYHAGHGTAMQVLNAGLPSVVIPFNGDHMEMSRQIEKLELGIRIKKYPDDITEVELKEVVAKVLGNKKYLDNAQKFQHLIKKTGNAAMKAADFIENYHKELQKANLSAAQNIQY